MTFELPPPPFGPPDEYDPALRGARARGGTRQEREVPAALYADVDVRKMERDSKRLHSLLADGRAVKRDDVTSAIHALVVRINHMRSGGRYYRWTDKAIEEVEAVMSELREYRAIFRESR